MDLIGRRIENFRIDALLGEGGMGAVYRAYDVNLARPVALKVLHQQFAKRSEFQRRFLQEAQAAARLGDHASIVNIYTFGSSGDLLYMVMEFVSGSSLGAYIKHVQERNQVVKLGETLNVLAQVADALAYAHRQGVIHRDVKPDNVLLKPLDEANHESGLPMRAIVTDFGLAKLLEGGVETQTGTFMGTLPYMSPEQTLGKQLDGRSDLYSLGIMLYQLATGKLPFHIKTPTEAVLKHLNEEPPDPKTIKPGVPESVVKIIVRSIAKTPDDRYQTGEEMAEALRRAASGLTDDDVTRFAPPNTVVSLATRILPEDKAPAPSRIGYDLTALPGQARVLIARKGEEPRAYSLDKDIISIGRAEDNDIILPIEGVSRRHARIERGPGGSWQVVDAGSTNGTFLADTRLLPDVPEIWEPGQPVRIGAYYLNLQQAEGRTAVGVGALGDSLKATAFTPVSPEGTQAQSSSSKLSIIAEPTSIVIPAGGRATIQLQLLNQGMTVDHYKVTVSGIPQEWVAVDSEPVQLMPGAATSLPITIQPPRNSSAHAGEHAFRIAVASTSDSRETASAPGQLTIEPFEQFSIDMRPKQVRNSGVCRVLVRNEGNAESDFTVIGRDPGDAIDFGRQREKLRLGPGERGTTDLTVSAKNRPFMGAAQRLPFEILVGTSSKNRSALAGQLEVRPVLPRWLIPLVGALLAIICISAAAVFFFAGNRNAQATQTAEAQLAGEIAVQLTEEAQSTASALETAQVGEASAATSTSIALTAQALGDDDDDGLDNNRELQLGTNPQKPDTDGDGLSDGAEVNQYGTNPNQIDSDGDTLSDGAEVNEHKTSPTNPDTDGDGIADGAEILAGSDPLLPPTAMPTDTATSEATATATATSTPSITPSPTSTEEPTATPTLTPVPNFALQFDGNDDFVSIAHGGDFDFNDKFTIEAWVRPTSVTGTGSFAAIAESANSEPPFSGHGWVMLISGGDRSDWGLSVCVPGCSSASSGPGGLVANEWQHVAGVYDGSQIIIYKNGDFVASAPHSGNVSDGNFLLVGIWSDAFRGQIDEVRLWNVARSPSNIQQTMNRVLRGNESGLVGYWQFNEGEGQITVDATANQNDGKLGAQLSSDENDPTWVTSDLSLQPALPGLNIIITPVIIFPGP